MQGRDEMTPSARLRPASYPTCRRARGPPRSAEQTRLLVKHFLAVLAERAPGASVEVRVPPYAAVQAVAGSAAHAGHAAGRGRAGRRHLDRAGDRRALLG